MQAHILPGSVSVVTFAADTAHIVPQPASIGSATNHGPPQTQVRRLSGT